MRKVVNFMRAADGTEVRITAEPCGPPLFMGTFTYVHFRKTPDQQWQLASNDRPLDWKSMSREEYLANGRSEVLRLVGGPGPLLRASHEALQGDEPWMSVLDPDTHLAH